MAPVTLVSLAAAPLDLMVAASGALTVRAGGRFKLPVVLANASEGSLGWSHHNPLHLAYRWLDEQGEYVERDGLRTIIPVAPLKPKSRVEIEVVGATPEDVGSYTLQLSLVLEGVHWACDVGTGGWLELAVQVVTAPAWPAELEKSRGARALRGALAAAELARQLEGRSLVAESPNLIDTQPDPVTPAAAVPLATEARGRVPLLHRLRGWFRAALGVSALERQLDALLAHADSNEQQVRQLAAQLTSLKDASRIQLETADDHAHRLSDELGDAQRDLKAHLLPLEAGMHAGLDAADSRAQELRDQLVEAARDLKSRIHAVAAETKEELSKSFKTSGQSAKQQLAQIGDIAGKLQQLISTEAVGAKKLEEQSRSLSGLLDRIETIRSIGDAQHGLLIDIQSQLGGQVAELGRLAEIESRLRSLGALQPEFDGITDAQSELGTKLEALAVAQQEVKRELSEGSVVVEVISNLRQLVAWAQSSGDGAVIEHLNESLRRLVAASGERGLSDASERAMLELHLISNSLKLDSLLTRQAIPLASAGLILVRNSFGLLAIQDEDAPAIAYYSTGDLPEPATVAIVERLLMPGDCFLDVGANVGIYSLIAGRRVGPEGTVVSVEPSPSTMRALRMTLAINGIAAIARPHECALGDAEGIATLHCEPTSGHNSLIGPTESTFATYDVAVKRGEAVLDGLNPALIKVDVEGWELDVLRGLEGIIQRSKRLSAIVEFSPEHIRRRGLQPEEWLEQLKSFGLNMWVIDDSDLSLRSFDKVTEIGDRGANLFLSRALPPALRSMLHDG